MPAKSAVAKINKVASKGETDLNKIFRELVKIVDTYSPPLVYKKKSATGFELHSIKDITFMKRQFTEMYFASAMIRSSYVVFYFMPVYAKPDLLKSMPERLIKCMKGKSCFHFKNWDSEMNKMVKDAVKSGFECYKKIDFI